MLEELQIIKGVDFPAWLKFRQLLVVGPPGAGKTTLIQKIGGWMEEGYIDLTVKKWWAAQSLSIRPREINLGLPFVGRKKPLAVFEEEWLEAPEPLELDLDRILIPPAKRHFFSVDWRGRYVFEFLLPPPQAIFEWRTERSRRGTHHVDQGLSLELVKRQVETYRAVAWHLHNSGLIVYVREGTDGPLRRCEEPGE